MGGMKMKFIQYYLWYLTNHKRIENRRDRFEIDIGHETIEEYSISSYGFFQSWKNYKFLKDKVMR
jgi:hypothetical protein